MVSKCLLPVPDIHKIMDHNGCVHVCVCMLLHVYNKLCFIQNICSLIIEFNQHNNLSTDIKSPPHTGYDQHMQYMESLHIINECHNSYSEGVK